LNKVADATEFYVGRKISPILACGRSIEQSLAYRLLGLRDADLWSATAEVMGLLRPQNLKNSGKKGRGMDAQTGYLW
jgi:hypothetical protein